MAENTNAIAVYLAKYFFKATNQKATPALLKQCIGQAKSLLNSGYTLDEIESGIDYFVKHPPRRGFQSLGWLSYALNEALVKIKAQKAKEEMQAAPLDLPQIVPQTPVEKKSSDKAGKGYDFGMFGE